MKFWNLIFSFFIISLIISCEKERSFQLVEQEFSISQDTIILRAPATSTGFFVHTNAGYLSYALKGLPPWLYVPNIQGQASSIGTFIELTIQNGQNTTTQTVNLTLETPLGSKNIYFVYIPERTSKDFVDEKISLLASGTSKTLNIFNPEDVNISWSATIDNEYISLNKTSGQMAEGGTDALTLSVNTDKLPSNGSHVSNITFVAHGKSYKTKVDILNQLGGLLDRDVVDAVFATNRNEIIFISNSPKSISKLNPITNQVTSLNLNLVPLSLTISQDNKTALIGCDARIIVVNMDNMMVTKTIIVDSKVKSIMYAPNNFAYTLTDGQSWSNLTEVNLTSGSYKKNPQLIYAGSIGKLHPNGKWLYLVDNGLSPSDIRKLSLSNNGESTYLYDSPYHGDYNIGGNLWFSESGDRILTGSVFLTSSDDMNTDMKYFGSLNLPQFDFYSSRIWSAVHSVSNNKWYLSLAYSYSEVKFAEKIYVYDSESYELEETIDILPILDQNGIVTVSEPRYVFSDQTNIYVLVKSQNTANWTIQTIKK